VTAFAETERADVTVVSRLGLALTVDRFYHPHSCVLSRVPHHGDERVAR
jgi:hypothetical protein